MQGAVPLMKKYEKTASVDVKEIYGKDHAESMQLLATDRSAAFVMDDILLYSLVAQSRAPQDYVISSEALSVEPYGIMLRKDDKAFKALADRNRLRILNSLLQAGGEPVCVCEFQPALGISQPTVSHHLKQLLEAPALLLV